MGELAPIIAAVVTTIGTIAAAAFGARRIAGRRDNGATTKLVARWREQAELEKARADLVVEERDRERAGRLEAEQKLGDTRHDLDDCVRQRDGAFSDLRAARRRSGTATP